MEIYNDTLCVSLAELTDGITTAANVRQLTSRGRITQVRRACAGTCALYMVESLPAPFKAEVYRRNPDYKEAQDSKPFVEGIEADGRAQAFFAEYTLADGRHLPMTVQEEYANGCAILRAFGRLLEAGNSHRMRQSKGRVNATEFWKKAAVSLDRIGDTWANNLPRSGRRLQAKYQELLRDGYEVMVSSKWANKNAAKVADEQQTALLMQLIGHHNNLDNVVIADTYNKVAEMQGWDKITSASVRQWRKKFDLVTAASRRGATNFRNERTMQVKRSRPTAPFLMWTLDGWDVELLYQKVEEKRGGNVTTYCNRMTLEVVLDPCCNYPIGYAIGTHETPALIAEALRDAARHTKELTGEMLQCNQIQCDHFGIKTMADLYKVMGQKLTPARVKNAKAKVVEPYFGYLNKTYCKMWQNWSGFGITTDPKKQPNSEALNMLRHSFPDEEGVKQQIHQMMAAERQTKRAQFMEMLQSLPSDRRLPLNKELYLYYFGVRTERQIAMEPSGIRPTLLGVKRDYDCWDATFREHAGEKWTVMYDPDDLGEVLAVNGDGSLRYMLKEKYVQPMALAERKEGDAEQLEAVRSFNKALEADVEERLALAYEKTEQLIADNPRLENILGRLLITDSRGQHKLPKAAERMKNSEFKIQNEPAASHEAEDYSIF